MTMEEVCKELGRDIKIKKQYMEEKELDNMFGDAISKLENLQWEVKNIVKNVEDKDTENKERSYDDGKEYWYVSVNNKAQYIEKATGHVWDEILIESGNFFNTKEEVEMEALRIEGMRVKQTAKKGDDFYVWSFELSLVYKHNDWNYHTMNKKFATAKEAQDWGDKYAKAFEDNNK